MSSPKEAAPSYKILGAPWPLTRRQTVITISACCQILLRDCHTSYKYTSADFTTLPVLERKYIYAASCVVDV